MRIRSFLQEIRFLSLSYWWMWLLCSHWNHLFLSSSFMCIYAMNWMNFFFCFSLVLFDGLIIALLYLFVNTFLWFYGIIFIYLFYYVFIFYNLFVFFIIFCKFVVLCRVGGVAKRTAEKGGGEQGLRSEPLVIFGGWGDLGKGVLRLQAAEQGPSVWARYASAYMASYGPAFSQVASGA